MVDRPMEQRVLDTVSAARPPSSATLRALALWTRCETAAISVLGIAALVIFLYGTLARYIFPSLSPDWAEEVSIYLMIWALLLSGGPLIGDSRHVTAEVVTHLLPAAIRHRLRLLGLMLTALFCAILGWLGWQLTQLAIAVGERGESSLSLPLGYYYVALMVAMALMSLRAIIMLLIIAKRPEEPAAAPEPARAVKESAPS